MSVLNCPVVLLLPVWLPKKELSTPVDTRPDWNPKNEFPPAVVFAPPANLPKNEFASPVVFAKPARFPKKALFPAVVLAMPAEYPKKALP